MERRLARTLALSFVVAFAPPALDAATPDSTPDQDAAVSEWLQSSQSVLAAHLARVVEEGSPLQAYLAANVIGMQQAFSPTGPIDAEAESRRIGAALNALARGQDDWVLALAEVTCELQGLNAAERAITCDRRAAGERLAHLADGNAYAHLVLWQLAVQTGDIMEAERQLAAAARAERYEEPFLAQARAIRAMYAGVDLPSVPAEIEVAVAESMLIEDRITAQLVAEMNTLATVFALSLPAYQPLMRHCFPDGEPTTDVTAHEQCQAIHRLMARHSPHLVGQTIANLGLARLAPESLAGRQAREHLRELSWLQAQSVQTAAARKDAAGWMQYIDALYARGEISALKQDIRRAGLPATPPPGWLPDHAPRADLISHGIYRAN